MTEQRTLHLDVPVNYLEYPGPAGGPTFVCVHGLGGSHTNFLSFAPLLAKRGRVLVPDLAGFGRTPLGSRTAKLPDNRALLDRFLVEMDAAPAILVGNSMGGLLSLMQAREVPEHTAGVIALNPALPRTAGAPTDRLVAATFATYLVPGVGERFVQRRYRTMGPERLIRETLELCTVDPARVSPDVVEAQLALARERATYPWAVTAFLQAARSLVGILARRNAFTTMIRDIAVPAMLVMGRHDRLVQPASAERVARIRPDWDFVMFEDCGHVPMMEIPDRLMTETDRWLTGPASRLLIG